MNSPKRLLIPLAVAAAGMLVPSAASASSVAFNGTNLVVTAAPGETNLIDIRSNDAGDGVLVQDRGGLPSDPGGACVPYTWSNNTLDCVRTADTVRVETGDGNDEVTVTDGFPGGKYITAIGGDGNDKLRVQFQIPAELDGGAGNDELNGGFKDDKLLGGPGTDTLSGSEGGDELRGGDGDDELSGDFRSGPFADIVDGGAGYDTIDSDWTAPLTAPQPAIDVTLDGVANDGRSGEGDNVTGIEKIHVSLAASLAAAGDPVDFEAFNYPGGLPSRLIGSPGADRLRSYDNHDTIDAGAGDDWIEAGFGDDTVTGGPGRDSINADAGTGSCNFLVCRTPQGNDTVHARDGEADSVECGAGNDIAYVDALDTVSPTCETVDRPSTSPPPPPPPGDDQPAPTVKKCKVPKVKAGAKLRTVQTALKKANCKAKTVKAKHKKIKKGLVIKVSPKTGKTLAAKATVKVYVSRGKR